MAMEERSGSDKKLIDSEMSMEHSKQHEPITALTPENPRSSSSSSSSSRSSDVEKDNPASPLIKSKQSEVELEQGLGAPTFSPEVSSHSNPGTSTQLLPPPSPQIPVMGQPGGYDPNRIPSSIFARPSNPMEWSVASNESLFSIHMGNNSFSRDHMYMLYKSGELPRLEETSYAPPSLNPAMKPEGNDKRNEDKAMESPAQVEELTKTTEKKEPESTLNIDKAKELIFNEIEKNQSQEHIPPVEEIRTLSTSSGRSSKSFQFPLLDVGTGRTTSVKEMMEKHPSDNHLQQNPQSETPATTPKTAGNNSWFSCFSCCSFGC